MQSLCHAGWISKLYESKLVVAFVRIFSAVADSYIKHNTALVSDFEKSLKILEIYRMNWMDPNCPVRSFLLQIFDFFQ